MKSARRRAREYAVQGLYQWQFAGNELGAIVRTLAEDEYFERADRDYFEQLLEGTAKEAAQLEAELSTVLDRSPAELSPIERAILLLAVYELTHAPEIPYRVVINEAIELAKTFGGTDGHNYVNGVLDRLSPRLRPHEPAARRR
jgi:N utilization substance protein B